MTGSMRQVNCRHDELYKIDRFYVKQALCGAPAFLLGLWIRKRQRYLSFLEMTNWLLVKKKSKKIKKIFTNVRKNDIMMVKGR